MNNELGGSHLHDLMRARKGWTPHARTTFTWARLLWQLHFSSLRDAKSASLAFSSGMERDLASIMVCVRKDDENFFASHIAPSL